MNSFRSIVCFSSNYNHCETKATILVAPFLSRDPAPSRLSGKMQKANKQCPNYRFMYQEVDVTVPVVQLKVTYDRMHASRIGDRKFVMWIVLDLDFFKIF